MHSACPEERFRKEIFKFIKFLDYERFLAGTSKLRFTCPKEHIENFFRKNLILYKLLHT